MHLHKLFLCVALLAISTMNAFAAERLPYERNAFQNALDDGKPILVHVTAPWCAVCNVQKPIVAALAQTPEFNNLTIFDVDYDTQKDAMHQLKVPNRSTLVVFKGRAEVARATGITRPEAIEAL